MKDKKAILLMVFVSALIIFSACSTETGELLEQDAANVTAAIIYYTDGTQAELAAEDEDLAVLADTLYKTGTEEKVIDQSNFYTSNKYAIDVTYSDGTLSQLFSDPDGVYFFRFVNDQSYLGGENKKIAELLEKIRSGN